ncbi:MAG: CMP-N,N-diacetyllegionaminic acid synthase [Patescibacteria group bacterium]|nr:CMP-N,N-diacetyllegionaminic acid synthase [Patescibacteria group bacterium]
MAYKKKTILAIIPARGASKAIPLKSIAKLGKKPLLTYTAEVALNSTVIDEVILSSDSPEIQKVAKKSGIKVPFSQPEQISQDTSPAIDVILHTLEWFEKNKSLPDILVYLQPTTPFRSTADIDAAIKMLIDDKKAQTIVSVTPLPHRFHPEKAVVHTEGYIRGLSDKKESETLNRHWLKKEDLYGRNGPSILAFKTDFILREKKLYGPWTLPYIMDDILHNIDIDDQKDLDQAEELLPIWKKRKNK